MGTISKLNGATTHPRTKYLTVLESVDELLRCENVLPSNDENASLTWQIHPVKGFLIAPEIMLNLQFSVKRIKKDLTRVAVADTDVVCLANYPLMSLFRTAEVEFNQVPIMPANTLLPYTALIRVLSEFDRDGRDSILAKSLFKDDLPYNHDKIGKAQEVFLRGHRVDPYTFRHDPIIDDKVVDLYGPLMIDIFRTTQPFPDDVEIRITLNRSPAAFLLNATFDSDTAGYEITIHRADLGFTRLRVEGNVYAEVGDTIEYPFSSMETRHFVVPGGSTISQEILSQNLPKRLISMLVSQEAFIGKYDENPFYFGHNLLESVYLRKNQNVSLPPDMYKTELVTKEYPATPAIPEQKDPTTQVVIKKAQAATAASTRYALKNTSRLYVESMRVLNDKSLNNINIGITQEDFESGRWFMCWDFRSDRKPPPGKSYIPGYGVVRMEATMHRPLTKPILLMCVLEYQRVLYISKKNGIVVV